MTTRLQLGASRLEHLDPRVLQVFLDKTWVHLGDPERKPDQSCVGAPGRVLNVLRKHGFVGGLRKLSRILMANTSARGTVGRPTELQRQTNFREFFYRKGDVLPFEDETMDFVFSEHFLEHLFLDESLALFTECHRILKASGVIRTCVPDADLRTYEAPETVGFPDKKLPYTHPAKHKTRWSVYSLCEALRICGFDPIPLHYCDRHGEYRRFDPHDLKEKYEGCRDREMVFSLAYVKRLDSLIVDGLKCPSSFQANRAAEIR